MTLPTRTAVVRRSGARIRSEGLLSTGALRSLADRLRAVAVGRRAWCDPRDLAYLAGFDLAVGFPEQGERTTAHALVFSWHADQRERGLSVHTELARAHLLREGALHHPDDVALLATELALPHDAAVRLSIEELIDAQRHYPIVFLRDAHAALRP